MSVSEQELRELIELWEDSAEDNMGSDSRLVHGYGRGSLTCAKELEHLVERSNDT